METPILEIKRLLATEGSKPNDCNFLATEGRRT